MKKWLRKNKDIILIQVFAGLILLFVGYLINYLLNIWLDNQNKLLNIFSAIMQFQVKIPVYIIVLLIILIVFMPKVYNVFKIRKQKLKIIKAIYYTDDLHSTDITNELNNFVENDKLKIVLNNKIADDPHKGTEKNGKVKYKINGIEKEKEYKENEIIELP